MARHRVQVLRAAGKTLKQVVAETGLSQRSVQRIERERAIEKPGDLLQACERGVGRPSVVAPWRARLAAVLAAEPELKTIEILHRLREQGYLTATSWPWPSRPCWRTRRQGRRLPIASTP